ncbi:hypothetical protein D3C73_1645000 [compost metagenome]
MIIDGGAFDDEHDAMRFDHQLLVDAGTAQPFGARALKEFQVVGIEDDAAGIGIFIVDTNGPRKI